MNQIVTIQLELLKKIIATQNINLNYDNNAVNYLANKGYDPAFGARPLKRIIQREVQNELAKGILSNKYNNGSNVTLSAGDDSLFIT